MSKSRSKLDDSRQISILDYIRECSDREEDSLGSYRIISDLRRALRAAIKGCPLSRHQIAGQMSHLLDTSITKEMIDSWTRESDEINGRPGRHIPSEFLPAFCKVTEDNGPLIVMGRVAGLFVLPGPEALRAEIQRLDEQIKGAQRRKRKRVMFLNEMEKEADDVRRD